MEVERPAAEEALALKAMMGEEVHIDDEENPKVITFLCMADSSPTSKGRAVVAVRATVPASYPADPSQLDVHVAALSSVETLFPHLVSGAFLPVEPTKASLPESDPEGLCSVMSAALKAVPAGETALWPEAVRKCPEGHRLTPFNQRPKDYHSMPGGGFACDLCFADHSTYKAGGY
eukprot:Selendium_serpulae@DN9109_c0_g1_i1.p1